VSNSAPVALQIGNTSGTYGPDYTGGWTTSPHTPHIVTGLASLNSKNTDRLIVAADPPVYVSVCQKSGSQGEILPSPARKGLGKEFRAVFARNILEGANPARGSFISVMVTAAGTTTVTWRIPRRVSRQRWRWQRRRGRSRRGDRSADRGELRRDPRWGDCAGGGTSLWFGGVLVVAMARRRRLRRNAF